MMQYLALLNNETGTYTKIRLQYVHAYGNFIFTGFKINTILNIPPNCKYTKAKKTKKQNNTSPVQYMLWKFTACQFTPCTIIMNNNYANISSNILNYSMQYKQSSTRQNIVP